MVWSHRAPRALLDHGDDLRQRGEARQHGRRIPRGADHRQQLARVAPPPHIAGRLAVEGDRDISHQLPGATEHESAPPPRLALTGERLEKPRLGLGPDPRHALRLAVIPDLSADSLCGFIGSVVQPGAVVHTDGWQAYRRLSRLGYDHRRSSQRQSPAGDWLLPRAHRSLSNLKAWLHGTHRDVSREHLQVYLDEFVFRHNRRRTPMAAFQTLLGLGTRHQPTTYRRITQHAA